MSLLLSEVAFCQNSGEVAHTFEVMEEEAIGSGACCMDISESGEILLGFESDDTPRGRQHVNIYKNNGEYETGISFVCNGPFYSYFEKEDVWIYVLRDDWMYRVSRKGEIVEQRAYTGSPNKVDEIFDKGSEIQTARGLYTYEEWYVIPFPGTQCEMAVKRTDPFGKEEVLIQRTTKKIWKNQLVVWLVRIGFWGGTAWIMIQVCRYYIEQWKKPKESDLI